MPNVPNVPGVPSLSSYLSGPIELLVLDAIGLFGGAASQWGVFRDGIPAFEFQSVTRFDYRQDWPVSDYPVEEGGFQSYDKVQLPFDLRLRVVSGPSESDRQALLDSIEDAANSLDLLDVVTPEKVYESVNITHYDLARTAVNGVGMLTVDVWFTEIRVTSTATFTDTKTPGAAGNQNLGNVQAEAPNQRVKQSFTDGNWQVQ